MIEKRKICQPSAGEGDDEYERPIYRKGENAIEKARAAAMEPGPQLHRHQHLLLGIVRETDALGSRVLRKTALRKIL